MDYDGTVISRIATNTLPIVKQIVKHFDNYYNKQIFISVSMKKQSPKIAIKVGKRMREYNFKN